MVEVHNTYGDRHAYLVHPDEQGRARTDKAMYVSPFHGTDGSYDVAVPGARRDRLDVAVTLHDPTTARTVQRLARPAPARRPPAAPPRRPCAAARS